MGKAKSTAVPNKVLHGRVSYLYQAASYFATLEQSGKAKDRESGHSKEVELSRSTESTKSSQIAARQLISDLKAVSLKAQIRMSPDMKHVMCKICNTVMIDGSTCSSGTENHSRGGKKPWADVIVRQCNICGTAKRFPVAKRQQRRPHRTLDKPKRENKLHRECHIT
ncbi:RNAse P Rpr2/Rpp21/SNM1 subunit domain-containing protein [Amylocarpus encephaloides]|uniref:RNAse P Rpr2/Rpp21/SNM1 subunit domain-containing protein n=1 Tax=Amylocarpus encephaloides TaxID=45428 RepID=A0A9P8C7S6_9HELO|nr:RNAse P Rpr2/Rpp21/SNM1 subunit domain-containing protein [Amylocarpus encephaloides]